MDACAQTCVARATACEWRFPMTPVLLQQPKRVFFGVDCAQRSAEEFAAAGRKRIFVVSSPTAARQNAALVAAWRASGAAVEVNDASNREPDIALFESVLAAARAFAPDAIVG